MKSLKILQSINFVQGSRALSFVPSYYFNWRMTKKKCLELSLGINERKIRMFIDKS